MREIPLLFIIRHWAENENYPWEKHWLKFVLKLSDLPRPHQLVSTNKIPVTIGPVFFWLMASTGVDKSRLGS